MAAWTYMLRRKTARLRKAVFSRLDMNPFVVRQLATETARRHETTSIRAHPKAAETVLIRETSGKLIHCHRPYSITSMSPAQLFFSC